MARIGEINPLLNSNKIDPRTRKYLSPKRVVYTQGDVTGAENLTLDRTNQISFEVERSCVLNNGADGQNAGVLVDFGVEFSGGLKLFVWSVNRNTNTSDDSHVNTEEGTLYASVRVRLGESVSEALSPLGHKNTTNDHATRDMIMSVSMLSANETNESGYRFAYIELLDPNVTMVLKSVTGVFCYRDLDYLGSFECNDEKLNKIWHTAAYTAHLNMQEYLWDGIKRDRLVWIGDMHTEVQTIFTVFGKQDMIKDSLDFMRDDTPLGVWMNGIPSYSIWWLMLHHDWYRQTHELDYLMEQKEYMSAIIRKLFDVVDENGVEQIGFKFLDWPTQANPAASHAGMQAMLKIGFEKASDLAHWFGDDKLADECAAMAKKMGEHSPECGGAKQAAAFLCLADLADAKKTNDEILSIDGAHGYSTFMGYYILAVKAAAGDTVGALRDIREYWGAMLDMGATTFWEDFDLNWTKNAARIDEIVPEGKIDIHGDFGAYCYQKFRHSLCHGWASGPCPYMTQYVLGIKALSPDTFEIKPDLADLEWAKGTYPTEKGIISVSVRRAADGSVECAVDAPEGITIIR